MKNDLKVFQTDALTDTGDSMEHLHQKRIINEKLK